MIVRGSVIKGWLRSVLKGWLRSVLKGWLRNGGRV